VNIYILCSPLSIRIY